MFYKPGEPHGLRHNPFNALVVPRPIGWITSLDVEGRVNLAPYSFFNAVSYTPPHVMFASTTEHVQHGGPKDTVANVEATKEFVANLVTWELREAMNATSAPAPHGVDELELAGLTAAPSELVKPPRVAESPVHLECRYVTTVTLPTSNPDGPEPKVVFGEVVGIHIDERVIEDGMIRWDLLNPVGRLGYMDYAPLGEVFTMDRPDWP